MNGRVTQAHFVQATEGRDFDNNAPNKPCDDTPCPECEGTGNGGDGFPCPVCYGSGWTSR